MQAIARVNRVFPGKTGGLVVDYLGVAGALRDAISDYTQSGGQGAPQLDITEAVAQMQIIDRDYRLRCQCVQRRASLRIFCFRSCTQTLSYC